MTFAEFLNRGFIGNILMSGTTGAKFTALYITAFVLSIVSGYLLGSINTAIIISRLVYGTDIRTQGSKNAGMTNMLRVYGKKAALFTLLGDLFKTFLAFVVGTVVFGVRGAYFACFMCVVGHIFPVFYRFRGGKGVAATAMMVLLLDPVVFLILLIIFIIIVTGTKYVSLGSIIVAGLYPIIHDSIFRATGVGWSGAGLITVLTGALIIWRHVPNMKRLYNKTEPKLSLGKSKNKNSGEGNSDIK
ncbi:MAG: glycerol-3-phosphate 1-O-acyltransferase PlsY [Clostridiales bacterium]|nr:glycerol-3-phosphate 1-O-acyltransferase PlsY [Clostridiales bacterium]